MTNLVPADGILGLEALYNITPVTNVGTQNIIPASKGAPGVPNRVTLNVISVTQETSSNIDITFPSLDDEV